MTGGGVFFKGHDLEISLIVVTCFSLPLLQLRGVVRAAAGLESAECERGLDPRGDREPPGAAARRRRRQPLRHRHQRVALPPAQLGQDPVRLPHLQIRTHVQEAGGEDVRRRRG